MDTFNLIVYSLGLGIGLHAIWENIAWPMLEQKLNNWLEK